VCVRERYRENRDEALIRERRFKDRTPPLSFGTASWRLVVVETLQPEVTGISSVYVSYATFQHFIL
jgi:hypothetical protein